MSKLNVDQKAVYNLMTEKKVDFLIPDYQRPYAWNEEQCRTLWDDLFSFSFPNNNNDEFDNNEEYFLGAIVTYKNDDKQSEVIDGQQRLTTLMLILRAFYDKFANMQDDKSKAIRELIEKCIWKTDEFGKADKAILKINSEVATDNDKEEFLELLRTGVFRKGSKSQYVANYRFYQNQIIQFLNDFPGYFPYFPARILNNCILLPIEAESQDTALRIFSTLNDRGLPLSDADIFKAQFYKYYGNKNKKDDFIKEWKSLEEFTSKIFDPKKGTPMDELFTRYMYFLRAKEGNKNTTTEALRKFYERNKYQYLKREETLPNLKSLVLFWRAIFKQDKEVFSNQVLKKLFILHYAPNGMWQNFVSVYYLKNRNSDGKLDNEQFYSFLNKITGFIFAYAITNPGVNALRTPIFDEMINIVNGVEVTFAKYRFGSNARPSFDNYIFTNQKNVTRSILTWYAFSFDNQELLDIKDVFHIEHIYPKKRQEMESGLQDESNLDSLGNKILLESLINIKASDYRFEDKKKIYTGEERRGNYRDPSKISEILKIANYGWFDENNIEERKKKIVEKFFTYLGEEHLLKKDSSE